MLKKISFFTIITALILLSTSQVKAASPTPKPTTEEDSAATASSEERNQMLENLERLTREKDQNTQTKDLYDDVGSKKRGFIAQVVSIKDKTVKISTINQTEQFLTFDKSTSLVSSGRETTADMVDIADWIDIGDWLVVIGIEEDDAFAPRRVLISSVDLTPKSKIVKIGLVDTINRTKLTYKTLNNEEIQSITLNTKTTLENNQGEAIKTTDFTAGDRILIVGVSGTAGDSAKTLRLLDK